MLVTGAGHERCVCGVRWKVNEERSQTSHIIIKRRSSQVLKVTTLSDTSCNVLCPLFGLLDARCRTDVILSSKTSLVHAHEPRASGSFECFPGALHSTLCAAKYKPDHSAHKASIVFSAFSPAFTRPHLNHTLRPTTPDVPSRDTARMSRIRRNSIFICSGLDVISY